MPPPSPLLSDLDERMAPLTGSTTPLYWHEPVAGPFRLSGFAWYRHDHVYRRLPLDNREALPAAVDHLADHTAGGQIAFQSDSRQIAIRVDLKSPADMNHMPATGQCGFDLYIGPSYARRFHGTTVYDRLQTRYEALLFEHTEARMREFVLNYPLYQGVKRVQIGLIPKASIRPPKSWSRAGRVVFYGTSVTQGGCASRPGMAYTNILSRSLNVEVVNLGFSGSGKGEPEVIRAIATVPDPLLFVLDYEANTQGDLATTLPEAIRILRGAHKDVPILVISRIAFAKDATHEENLRARIANRDLQSEVVTAQHEAGDNRIHFLDGSVLLGPETDEGTVDGTHPSDLGFMRMARNLEPVIRDLLGPTGQ